MSAEPVQENLEQQQQQQDQEVPASQQTSQQRRNSIEDQQKRTESSIQVKDKLYTGEVLYDKKDGFGIETDDKTQYQGYWRQNEYHGEGVYMQSQNLCFFKGMWKDNQKVAGIQIYPNGDQYEGEYDGTQFHGKGCLHNNTMEYRYEGDFIHGMKDGFGKEMFKSGAHYEGYFKKNQKHGKGKLTFKDGSYYQGDFVSGVPSGFGIYVAYNLQRAKSIMPDIKYLKQLEIDEKKKRENQGDEDEEQLKFQEMQRRQLLEKSKDDGDFFGDHFKQKQGGEELEEFYYEGEFIEGYKHGIGRQYDPNGSYYYCRWEFDKKVGNILFYNAQVHKYRVYKYKNGEKIDDHYQPLDEWPIKNQIENIIPETSGFPPDLLDAYKGRIDECGIQGDQFDDPHFQSEDNINKNIDSNRDVPPIEFLRITELESLEFGKKDLFVHTIRPCQIEFNEYSDYQLLTIFEVLSRFPYLLQNVFSVKYELDIVCYATLKLFISGEWKEIIIDDYTPVLRINRQPLFATSVFKDEQGVHRELGWILLQKVFCKYFGKYYYYLSQDFPKQCKNYLQLLTGLPCKSVDWHKLKFDSFNQTNQQMQELMNKVWKSLNSKKNPAKIILTYPRHDACRSNGVPDNSSYIVHCFERLEEDIGNLSDPCVLLVQTINPDRRIGNVETHNFSENSQVKKMVEPFQHYPNYKDTFCIFTLKEFVYLFGEMHILVGQNQHVQNTYKIKSEIKDFVNNDHRFYVQFSVNLPTKALINIQQQPQISEEDETMFPVRIILANKKDAFANTKKEYIQKKILSQIQKDVLLNKEKKQNYQSIDDLEEENTNRPKAKSILQTPQKSQIGGNTPLKANYELTTNTISNEPVKKKNLPFKYIFGKGQKKQENLFKTVELETGQYILLVQVEGPSAKEGIENKKKSVEIDLTISIFSESLIHIQHLEEPENFLRQLYEQAMIDAEAKTLKGRQIPFFSRSDLQDRERGCHDLIITQYFLKWEGTYLQYLQNQSSDKNQKSWRQKLYFRTENMKILDQNDPHKVDEYLLPGQEHLIIIQQQGAKNFNLEGGEGICIIEKIGKNKNSDVEDDDEDDEQPVNQPFKKFTEGIQNRKIEKKLEEDQKNLNLD